MDPSLNWVGDTFKNSYFMRQKILHTVGCVAQVKFVPVEHNEGYTGIFEGADYGLMRLSSALFPNTANKQSARGSDFAPGMALKFLRDGQPSCNLVAMFSVEG